MLLSQSFRDVSENHKKFHQSSGESDPPHPTPQSYSQSSMSVSSLSSSSSPLSDATPPGIKQHCSNLEPCENGTFSKNENPSFQIEQIFGKVAEPQSRPPRSDSCPNGLFNETTHGSCLKSQNDTFCYSPTADSFGKVYDHAGSFDSHSSSALAQQAHSYNRTSSQDLSTNGEQILTQQGSSANRKSYDNITDKELRKKLKNRESAQAARDRKKAKMLSLERQVSELHERYRMVESENQELRIRIQRMESSAYWRNKHDSNGLPADSAGILPFPVNHVGSFSHGAQSSGPTAYDRSGQYSGICGFGEYVQHSQCIAPGAENGDESNVTPFSQMPLEGAEFHSSSYVPNVWPGESSLTDSHQQGTFPNESNYSDSGSLIG